MSKSTKVIAALGVAAGLGVAALPISTFAVTDLGPKDVTITAVLDTTHTIEVDAATKTTPAITAGQTDYSQTSTITVKSNNTNGYTITVAAAGTADGDKTSLVKNADNKIAAFSEEQTTLANATPGWGGKLGGEYTGASGLTNTGWNGFKDDGSQIVFKTTSQTGTDTSEGDSYTVNYGIATSPSQQAGNYTGKVTYTLSAAD